MNKEDKKLLSYYKIGWNDCSNYNPRKIYNNELIQKAYNQGYLDYLAGDIAINIDHKKEKDILNKINRNS